MTTIAATSATTQTQRTTSTNSRQRAARPQATKTNKQQEIPMAAKEKLEQAKINGYDEFYNIKVSNDGKYFEITVKKTGFLYPDPDAAVIKKDFGLKSGVLIDNNPDVFPENPTGDTRSFDEEKIKGGTFLKLPISEVNFNNGPSGFFGRLFHVI